MNEEEETNVLSSVDEQKSDIFKSILRMCNNMKLRRALMKYTMIMQVKEQKHNVKERV